MISVKGKNRTITIPDSWDELTPDQYVSTVKLIYQVIDGELTIIDFRLKLLQELTGYERSNKRFDQDEQDQINSNLYLLAEMLKFPIKPNYLNPELLTVLSQELQKKLRSFFPWEITDEEFLPELSMISDRLECSMVMNLNMHKNPIPYLPLSQGRGDDWAVRLLGPTFNIDHNGMVETDIMAGEYVDAMEYYLLFQKTKEVHYLDMLVSMLYRPERGKHNTFEAQLRAKTLEPLDINLKRGVFLFFQNIQEYLINRSLYKILFNREDSDSKVISLGIIATIYNLAKKGYGTPEEINTMFLPDYLNMLLDMLIDAVGNMRSMDLKDPEIADKLKVPLYVIMQI
jgi:hypothetical protein